MDFLTLESFFKDMEKRPAGAKFYRLDLHNHTPADPHFNPGNLPIETEQQKTAFAQKYIRFALDKKIEIIGITDHNSVEWLPYMQTAANEQGMILFPGIEIGAKAGRNQVHFIVLFDPGTNAEEISHYISGLGLQPAKRFHTDGTPYAASKNVEELLGVIAQPDQSLRGLPIAAHVSGKNGLLKEMDGEQRIFAYRHKHLIAVEIPGALKDLSDFECNTLTGKNDNYGNKSVACLNHSDGRGLKQVNSGYLPVGEKSTRVKLSKFNIEALRQAFMDFESRVRLETEYHDQSYPSLLGVVIENGFLAEKMQDGSLAPFILHFNPNLNTVIGGRGAGKSALIEALRFVFNIRPRTDDTKDQSEKIQAATLPGSARVTAFYRMPKGETYAITRVKTEEPEVCDMTTGQKINIRPDTLLRGGAPVEIYGQREIFEITKDEIFQLNLIEGYVSDELRELKHQEQDLLNALKVNGQNILNLTEEIAQYQQRLSELPNVRMDLENMERQNVSAQLEEKKKADRESALLNQAEEAVAGLREKLSNFQEQYETLSDSVPDVAQLEREQLLHPDFFQAQKTLLDEMDQVVRGALARLGQELETLWQKGEAERKNRLAYYQDVQEKYKKLQATLGSDVNAEEYLKLQSRLRALEGIESEVERRLRRLDELKLERTNLQQKLGCLRQGQIFPVLEKKCRQLTDDLLGNVRVTVDCQGNRKEYAEKLRQVFSGRRIEQSVIKQLTETTLAENQYADAPHLVNAIRLEQASPADENSILNTIYGVSKAYRDRLAKLEDEVLFDLETYYAPDLPDIALRINDQYRSLNPQPGQLGLSTGQKSTAILSLILVERGAPLVIDQPEDDLDNEFIFREIVKTLRREKERRQFIVATHNANIPVSGDAELIVLLKADHENGWAELSGSIDDPEIREPVEIILEGGKDAFLLRQSKYQMME